MGEKFNPGEKKYDVVIEYCVPCDLREAALSTASELLKKKQLVIGSLTLVTGTAGVFDVKVNGQIVYSKKETGRVPENEEILEAFNRVEGAGVTV